MQPPAAAAVLLIAPGNPCGRIEHEKEKDERRNQQSFGERAASQLYHQGNKIELVCFGARDQLGDGIWAVDDVGVGE